MGIKYIWDTNTVIYYLQNNFPSDGEKLIDNIADNYQPAISIISEIELLCWPSASEDDILLLKKFISKCVVYELDNAIKLKTIEIRKQFKLKLPDAVIAATAIVNNYFLISRNATDFNKISSLNLVNPFIS